MSQVTVITLQKAPLKSSAIRRRKARFRKAARLERKRRTPRATADVRRAFRLLSPAVFGAPFHPGQLDILKLMLGWWSAGGWYPMRR